MLGRGWVSLLWHWLVTKQKPIARFQRGFSLTLWVKISVALVPPSAPGGGGEKVKPLEHTEFAEKGESSILSSKLNADSRLCSPPLSLVGSVCVCGGGGGGCQAATPETAGN